MKRRDDNSIPQPAGALGALLRTRQVAADVAFFEVAATAHEHQIAESRLTNALSAETMARTTLREAYATAQAALTSGLLATEAKRHANYVAHLRERLIRKIEVVKNARVDGAASANATEAAQTRAGTAHAARELVARRAVANAKTAAKKRETRDE